MKTLALRVLKQWFPLAIAVSAVCFTMYIVMQQNIRLNANNPQTQMAEDLANDLQSGRIPHITNKIDVSSSLAPFTITYDTNGNVFASGATLNGKTPVLPIGVLNATRQIGENKITWQPQEGVRLAVVIVPYDKGYVLVGRNMREVEMLEYQELMLIVIGWLASLIVTLFSVIIIKSIFKPSPIKKKRK